MSSGIERIRIATSTLSNKIYVGRINKKGDLWLEKKDMTDDALCAVRDHLYGMLKKGQTTVGYQWTRQDGKIVELRVTIKEAEKC